MDNEPCFPGIELSDRLHQKIQDVTSRKVVNELVLAVSKEAFDKGDPEAIFSPGYEADNYTEIAEWVSRSTVVCHSGSAGTSLGLSLASDIEVVTLGYTHLSQTISDTYIAYLEGLGIQTDTTHITIEPFFFGGYFINAPTKYICYCRMEARERNLQSRYIDYSSHGRSYLG